MPGRQEKRQEAEMTPVLKAHVMDKCSRGRAAILTFCFVLVFINIVSNCPNSFTEEGLPRSLRV